MQLFTHLTGGDVYCINVPVNNTEEMASAGGNSTVLPPANRKLQRKWDERRLQEHRDRVS